MNFFKNKAGAAPGIGDSKVSPFPGNRGAVPQRNENPPNITGAFARATAPPPGGVPAGKKFVFGKKTESSSQQLASPKDSETRRLQFDTPSPEGPHCSPIPAAAQVSKPVEAENRPIFTQPFFGNNSLGKKSSINGSRGAPDLDSGRRCLEDAYTDPTGLNSETQSDEHAFYSDQNDEVDSMNTNNHELALYQQNEIPEKETYEVNAGGESQRWNEAPTWTSDSKQNQQEQQHESVINHQKDQQHVQEWEELSGEHLHKQQEQNHRQQHEMQKEHHHPKHQNKKLQQQGVPARKVSRESREGTFFRPSEQSVHVQASPRVSSTFPPSRPKQQQQPQPKPQLVVRSPSSAGQFPSQQKIDGRPPARSITHPAIGQNDTEGQNSTPMYTSHEECPSVASSRKSTSATPPILAAPSEEPQRRLQSTSEFGAAAARLSAPPSKAPLEIAQKASSPRGRHQAHSSDPNSESAVGKRNYWSRSECNTEFGKESRKALTEIKQYRDALTALERGGLDNMVLVAQQHAITLARIAAYQNEFTEINALQTKISSLRNFIEKEFQLADDTYDRAQKGLLPAEHHPEDHVDSIIDNSNVMHEDSNGTDSTACNDKPPNLSKGLDAAVFSGEEKECLPPDVCWVGHNKDADVEAEINTAEESQRAASTTPIANDFSGMESLPHITSEAPESDVNSTPFTSPESAMTNSTLKTNPESDLSEIDATPTHLDQSNKNVSDPRDNMQPNDGNTGPELYRPQVLHFTGEAEEEQIQDLSSIYHHNAAEELSHPNEGVEKEGSSSQDQSNNHLSHDQDLSVDSTQSSLVE